MRKIVGRSSGKGRPPPTPHVESRSDRLMRELAAENPDFRPGTRRRHGNVGHHGTKRKGKMS